MLFDTDVLIWSLRGNHKAAQLIDVAPELFLSSVSYMKLLKGARDKRELISIKGYLHDLGFRTLPISENISHRAMIYMEEYVLKSGIDMADALIAATAAEHSLTICTGNNKLYKSISDIHLSIFRP
jgi:predicted nucleic acid-binding protein